MMVRHALALSLAASVLGCSAILGLEEPTIDDSLDSGGDGGTEGDASDEVVPDPCGADLQNDPANCGACAHDCLGGACSAGACQPALVTQSTVIAPYALALDNGTIYFTNVRSSQLHTVMKVDAMANAATPTLLVDYGNGYTNPLVDAQPWGLAVQSGFFYTALYANGGTGSNWEAGVDRCPLTGCSGSTLAVYGPDSFAIGANTTSVFWGATDTSDKYTLQKAALDFSGPTTIATPASEINGLAVDGDDVFFGTFDGVFACTPTCGTSSIAQGTGSVELLALDANNVYFSSDAFGIQSVPRSGGVPSSIASGLTTPNGVAVDSSYVYFTDIGDTSNPSTGAVARCPLTGCNVNRPPVVLSTGTAAGDNPRGIVVDDKAIYWGTRGGKIWRLAK